MVLGDTVVDNKDKNRLDIQSTRWQTHFSCKRSENIFAAIEKCLDNGTGVCFVVDEEERLIGRITLDDIRQAILDGAVLEDASLARVILGRAVSPAQHTYGRGGNAAPEDGAVTPVLDSGGRLVDVLVDRSKQPVQITRPNLSRHEFRALLDAFMSTWISSKGPYISKFEKEFASYVGMKHGIAVSNGTAALHLALLALGIGPGDEVIVPDITFAATINAALYCGATPVIVDIDRTTWTMSVEHVAHAFTPRTKAVIPVHLYGRPAEIGPIVELAKERNVHVVEDCAEAHGARYADRMVGQFGDISCFSFFASKIVTTGEGGMCLTNSDMDAAVMIELRDHGMKRGLSYWHERIGHNYRMTNLQAALGCTQIRRIEETLKRNAELDRLYRDRLGHIPGIEFPPSLAGKYEPVVWLVCVRVPADKRSHLIEAAADADIELRPFFHSLSAMPPYRKYARPCPNSVALSRSGINLPTSDAVDGHVVEKIAKVFSKVLC